MKQVLLSILCLFVLGNLQAQDDQYTIIVKKSADWCPNCGGWAWPVFEEILDKMEGRNGIPILMHHTGGLANDVAAEITDNLGGVYQPEFFLDNEIQNINSNNADDKIALIVDAVDLNASLGAFMGVDINDVYLSEDGTMLSVDMTQMIMNNGLEGRFSVGVYLIQNNIMHNQSGKGNVLQPKLLTGSFTGDTFGAPVDIDASSVGDYTSTLSIEAPSTLSLVDGDTEIVTIIWRWDDDGIKYVFNADHWSGEISQLSNTNERAESLNEVTALFRTSDLQVNINAASSFDNVSLLLTDVTGKRILSDNLILTSGDNSFTLPASDLRSGVYVLNMSIGNQQITQKIFKR